MTHHTGVIYDENDTELSWSIKSIVDYEENKIWQLCD